MVGLGNVDDTSGSNKPISSATQSALNNLNGKIPDLLYGIMKLYDDDTGTGRGVISHATALHFARTQSINPITSIIMTMSQNTGVVVNGNFIAQNIYNNTEVNDGFLSKNRTKRKCSLSAKIYRCKNHSNFKYARRRQRPRRYRRTRR